MARPRPVLFSFPELRRLYFHQHNEFVHPIRHGLPSALRWEERFQARIFFGDA
jgi:hypothetical protein